MNAFFGISHTKVGTTFFTEADASSGAVVIRLKRDNWAELSWDNNADDIVDKSADDLSRSRGAAQQTFFFAWILRKAATRLTICAKE